MDVQYNVTAAPPHREFSWNEQLLWLWLRLNIVSPKPLKPVSSKFDGWWSLGWPPKEKVTAGEDVLRCTPWYPMIFNHLMLAHEFLWKIIPWPGQHSTITCSTDLTMHFQRSRPHLFKLLFGLQKFSVLSLGEIRWNCWHWARWAAEMGFESSLGFRMCWDALSTKKPPEKETNKNTIWSHKTNYEFTKVHFCYAEICIWSSLPQITLISQICLQLLSTFNKTEAVGDLMGFSPNRTPD